MSYAESIPNHSRSSCSDADPCNADPFGTGCFRCNALLFDRIDEMRNLLIEHTGALAGSMAGELAAIVRADKWKAIAINMHAHAAWVRSMDRPLLEEAIRSTRRSDYKLAAFYAALLEEMP